MRVRTSTDVRIESKRAVLDGQPSVRRKKDFDHQSTFSEAFILLKFTFVVDNDTTLHGVHTDTVAFSPSVLIKSGICS